MRRKLTVLTTALLMLFTVFAFGGQASAAGACNNAAYYVNGYNNPFNGPVGTDYGSQAQMVTRPAALCNNSSAQARMTVGLASRGGEQFVEAGYISLPGQPILYYSDYYVGGPLVSHVAYYPGSSKLRGIWALGTGCPA